MLSSRPMVKRRRAAGRARKGRAVNNTHQITIFLPPREWFFMKREQIRRKATRLKDHPGRKGLASRGPWQRGRPPSSEDDSSYSAIMIAGLRLLRQKGKRQKTTKARRRAGMSK